jgi:hypothetical protein
MPTDPRPGFIVKITLHTEDARGRLDPQSVRDIIGSALEKLRVEEEIDFTLEVKRG